MTRCAALALPGVHAVLTYKNVRRVIYATGGQSYPNHAYLAVDGEDTPTDVFAPPGRGCERR